MHKKKDILIIAYYFPPYSGGATARIHSITKYLPPNLYNIHVLTIKEKYYTDEYRDVTLMDEFGPHVNIYKAWVPFGNLLKTHQQRFAREKVQSKRNKLSIKLKKTLRGLMVPDETAPWITGGFSLGRSILKSLPIEIIFSTAPPASTHLLATLLSKSFSVPLVLDYRDLLSQNPFYEGTNYIKRLVNTKIEIFNLNQARSVVVTNRQANKILSNSFKLRKDKVFVVENGYDKEEFEKISKNFILSKFIRINYIGSLTRKRTPKFFLSALEVFQRLHSSIKIKLGFIGFVDAEHQSLFNNSSLKNQITCFGSVSRSEALDIMCNNSDILLLFQRASEGGDTAIPAKLYEYFASRHPVLVMDDQNGATTEFANQLDGGYIANYENTSSIIDQLSIIVDQLDILDDYNLRKIPSKILNRYDLAQQISKIFKDLL